MQYLPLIPLFIFCISWIIRTKKIEKIPADLKDSYDCVSVVGLLFDNECKGDICVTYDQSRLDFSIESLDYVESIVRKIPEHLIESNHESVIVTYFRFGLYVGEVVRTNDEKQRYYWKKTDLESLKGIASELTFDVAYTLLRKESGRMTWPVNKLIKVCNEDSCGALAAYALVFKKLDDEGDAQTQVTS